MYDCTAYVQYKFDVKQFSVKLCVNKLLLNNSNSYISHKTYLLRSIDYLGGGEGGDQLRANGHFTCTVAALPQYEHLFCFHNAARSRPRRASSPQLSLSYTLNVVLIKL